MRLSILILALAALLGIHPAHANPCDPLFARVEIKPDIPTLELETGQKVQLIVNGEVKFENGYFLGKRLGKDGAVTDLVFVDMQAIRTLYFVPPNDVNIEVSPQSVMVAFNQQKGPLCAVHAFCSGVRQLKALGFENAATQKLVDLGLNEDSNTALFEEARKWIKPKNVPGPWRRQKKGIENFLKENGISYKYTKRTKKLIEHLKQQRPAVIGYLATSRHTGAERVIDFTRDKTLFVRGSRMPKKDRSLEPPSFIPNPTSLDAAGFHAILAVGVISTARGEEIVVLDSAVSTVNLLPASKFVSGFFSPNKYFLLQPK